MANINSSTLASWPIFWVHPSVACWKCQQPKEGCWSVMKQPRDSRHEYHESCLSLFFCCSSSFECTDVCSGWKKKQLISPAGDPYASRLEAAKTWFSREKRRNEWTKLYTLGQLAKVIVLPWVGQGGILTFKGGFTKGMRKSWKSHNCDEIAVARHWMYGVFTYIYPLQQCIPYIECLAYILSD